MRFRQFLPLVALGLAPISAARGQVPRLLKGKVVSEVGRQVLPGADISILDGPLTTARTGMDGAFQVPVPPGAFRVQIRRIGYDARVYRFRLRSDTIEVEFALKPLAVTLESLTVSAAAPRITGRLEDFERRRKVSAGGQFLGPEELIKQQDRSLADGLRHLRGLRIVPVGGFAQAAVTSRESGSMTGGGSCYLPVWLDGIQVSTPGRPYDLSRHRVDEMAGIEVYVSSAATPIEFTPPGSTCGAIVMWTRDTPKNPR